jgi:hypothetical protein
MQSGAACIAIVKSPTATAHIAAVQQFMALLAAWGRQHSVMNVCFREAKLH